MENQNLPYFIYGNERAVIDTGSPTSFGRIRHINICGDNINLGALDPKVAKCMPENAVALLGMDIIRNYDLSIDNQTKEGVFSKELKEEFGSEIVIGDYMGVPTFRAIIENKKVDCIFDTGAHVSYIDPIYLRGLNPVSRIDDCSPICGIFSTNLWRVTISISGIKNSIDIGILPPDFGRQVLGPGKPDAIIGSSHILCQRILFSYRRKKLYFE